MLVMVRGRCVGFALGAAMLIACGGTPNGPNGNGENEETTGASGSALAQVDGDSPATTTTASRAAATLTQPTKAQTTPAGTATATLGSATVSVAPTPIFTLSVCGRFSSWLVQVPHGTACTNVSTGADGMYVGQSGTAWIADLAEYWAHRVAPANTPVDATSPAFLAWAKSTVVPTFPTFDPLASGASFCQYWWRGATDANDAAYQMGYGSTPSEHASGLAHESVLTSHVGGAIEESCMPPEVEEVGDNGCVTYGNHPSCMGCAMIW